MRRGAIARNKARSRIRRALGCGLRRKLPFVIDQVRAVGGCLVTE